MVFTEINSRGKRGELLGRIDRQNSRFRTAKTTTIKFGLYASFVELESAKSALNELEVSEELGIAQNVVFRLWQRFQDDGNVSRCYSTGHPRVTTPNEDRYIYLAITAKRNRRSTAPQTCLVSYRYDNFKADRVQTIKAHWSICSFSLQSDSRRTLIWRAPGTRYHQENTIERHRYGGAGWLVWGGNYS
ncbi:cubilin [Trichonephila clavipes]|nr:cubilin [Trichonephila clavipes]